MTKNAASRDSRKALTLLSKSLPPPGEPPLLSTHRGHRQLVHALAPLPDGQRYLSASEDRTMELRSLATGEVLRRFKAHREPVNHLALNPSGTRLITGCDDQTVRIWSTRSWRTLRVLRGHRAYVRQVAASDRLVISGAQDRQVRVWDIRKGTCLQVFEVHGQDVLAVAISPDGKLAASSSKDNALFLWDLERGERRAVLYESGSQAHDIGFGGLYLSAPNLSGRGHRDTPRALAFTADGRHLLSADHEVILWDLETMEERCRYPGLGWPIQAIAALPGGRFALGGRGVHLWQLRRGDRWLAPDQARWLVTLDVGGKKAEALGVTARGDVLLSGHEDGAVKLWKAAPGRGWLDREAHPDSVTSLSCAPGGARAASRAADGSVRLWDTATATLVARVDSQLKANGGPMAFTPGGRSLLVAGKKTLEVWDALGGERRQVIEGPLGERGYEILGLAAAGEGLAVIGALGEGLSLWDLTGKGAHRLLEGRTKQVSEIACSPEGRLALTRAYMTPPGQEEDWRASCDHLQCWDLTSGALRWTLSATKPEGAQWPLSFGKIFLLPDGARALTLSGRRKGFLTLWSLEAGAPLKEIDLEGGTFVTALRPLKGGLTLAAVTGEERASLLWLDLEGGRVRRRLELPGAKEVALLLGEGEERALIREPRQITLIDLETGQPGPSFTSPEEIRALATSPESRTILVGDNCGAVHHLAL